MRCAKVLLLEAKPEKALEIYAYGLKVLPSGHPRREVRLITTWGPIPLADLAIDNGATSQEARRPNELEQERSFYNASLRNGSTRYRAFFIQKYCVSVYPIHLLHARISSNNFKRGILRVCKSWERFFGNMRELWMKIDLSGARQKVPWTAVRAYIRRSRGLLTHATFKNLALSSTPKSIEFLSRCPRLEHLELWVNHDFKDIFQKFKGCKSLKNIILSAEISVPHSCLERLLTQFPKLERIELWSVKHSLLTIGEGNWPQSLPNLKSITLATQQAVSTAPPTALVIPNLDHVGPHFFPDCPCLTVEN